MISNIVENIVVNVKNVHIRYEDRVSASETPFSIGVVFRDIAVYTTNAKGQKIFFDSGVDNDQRPDTVSINKRAHVKSFSIYWSGDKHFRSLSSLSTPQWKKAMQQVFLTGPGNTGNTMERFLLSPMDTYLRFIHYRNRSIRKPSAYEVNANLDRLKLNISMSQYRNLLSIFQNQKQEIFSANASRLQFRPCRRRNSS